MRYGARVVIAMVAAFFLQGAVTAGFYQTVGERMLEASGWIAGAQPPTDYMQASVMVALLAALLAGIAAAVIVGRARFRVALFLATLFVVLAIAGNRATLFDNPHPYEWPLIIAPLLAMPFGAWIVMRIKPLARPMSPLGGRA
jgi:hypothetical protein